MGWSVSSIIIPSYSKKDHQELLESIGFASFEKINDQPYDTAMHPGIDKVYIGSYKNNLIICASGWPALLINGTPGGFEKKLVAQFPGSEICAVSLGSTTNHWGSAIIKNGQMIRAKAGDADLGTVVDYGNPLEEEKALLACSQIDSNGNRIYFMDGSAANPLREDQVGENFIFELFKRYTGSNMVEDEDLLDTVFSGYQINAEAGGTTLDAFISDTWHGSYTLGAGYREELKGKTTYNTMTLRFSNGELTGTCIDEGKEEDGPATLHGFMVDIFIGFIHKYPFRYVIDNEGNSKKDTSRPHNNIAYSGIYNPDSDSFEGIWRIENTPYRGTWLLNRNR